MAAEMMSKLKLQAAASVTPVRATSCVRAEQSEAASAAQAEGENSGREAHLTLLRREDDAAATLRVGGRLLARVALVRLGDEAHAFDSTHHLGIVAARRRQVAEEVQRWPVGVQPCTKEQWTSGARPCAWCAQVSKLARRRVRCWPVQPNESSSVGKGGRCPWERCGR